MSFKVEIIQISQIFRGNRIMYSEILSKLTSVWMVLVSWPPNVLLWCALYSTKDLIRKAIQSDDFLKHLTPATVIQIVDCMSAEYINKDSNIIQEGDVGSKLYVIEGMSYIQ